MAAAGPIAHADWFVGLFVRLFIACEIERLPQLLKIMEITFGQSIKVAYYLTKTRSD